MRNLEAPLSKGSLETLGIRLKEVEESARADGAAFWGAQCALPFEQSVVASLIRETEVLMLFLAAQQLLLRDLCKMVEQKFPMPPIH